MDSFDSFYCFQDGLNMHHPKSLTTKFPLQKFYALKILNIKLLLFMKIVVSKSRGNLATNPSVGETKEAEINIIEVMVMRGTSHNMTGFDKNPTKFNDLKA